MSTRPTTLPEDGTQERIGWRRWIPRLRNTKIRSKLALLLVVPVTAVLALATVRLIDVGKDAYQATNVRAMTDLSVEISALVQELHKERMAAAEFLAAPSPKVESYNQQVQRTDERIARYNTERRQVGSVPGAVENRLKIIDEHLAALNSTRQEVLDRKQMPVGEAVLRYGVIVTDLVGYSEVLGQSAGEGDVADSLRAFAAFARAKGATAEEEALVYSALSTGRFEEEQFSSLVAILTSQQEALLAFTSVARSAQKSLVDTTVTGDIAVLADRVVSDLRRSVGQKPVIDATTAANAIGAMNDLMRWAEMQLEVRLLEQAEAARAAVVQQAITEGGLVLATLVLAVVLAIALVRSLNESLRKLRENALAVANHELPDAVSRMRDLSHVSDGSVEEIVRQVRDPIRISNQDEIGQVAMAFNAVHREAVRVAAEQAALRTNVSAMFLSLARRSQSLVDRMIGELDMIERGEEDPKRLAKLFELDHLATRMRRNDENLLVLAGGDSATPRREDALLVDALRAAQSEVEQYNRIEFGTVDTDISIAAHAVNDVVRLVAELLDNATRFSAPHTTVVADARRIRDYVLIQVEDRGLGLSEEQLSRLNRRLAAPADVDVSAFRLMGLAVVSRLAARYGIRVELRRNVEGGIVAQVTLPNSTVVLPEPPARDQVLGRPREPLAVEPGPSTPSAPSTPSGPPAAKWSGGMAAAVGGRTAAATLPDREAPAPWQPGADPDYAVSAGRPAVSPSLAAPSTPATLATPAPAPATLATPATAGAVGGNPLLPRRVPGIAGEAAAAPGHPSLPAPAAAGLPAGPVAGSGAGAAVRPEPAELPIFKEMEATWFRAHGQDATEIFHMPPGALAAPTAPVESPAGTAATAPTTGLPTVAETGREPLRPRLATRTPGLAAPPSAGAAPTAVPATAPEPAPATPVTPVTPSTPPVSGSEGWRTAADEGWALANRAAEPASAGTTRSGLPKRVPQAQLVPGGVAENTSTQRAKRTPDEVRGLLSAYHRGVQRGRTAGIEETSTGSTKETS